VGNLLTDKQEFLETVRIPIRLSCLTETGWPVVISLWYLYRDGLLYCATQKTAKIVQYLKGEPRCGFEIAEDRPPYCGIRGLARARIDKSLGQEILSQLLVRYLGNTENRLSTKLLSKSETEVAIELIPHRIFTWDFSDRMADLNLSRTQEKICP
jgi:hypothetical protein